jgi:hypothetical protein
MEEAIITKSMACDGKSLKTNLRRLGLHQGKQTMVN